MHMTTAEQRAKKMDVKHAMLAERAKQARDRCEALAKEYVTWLSRLRMCIQVDDNHGKSKECWG